MNTLATAESVFIGVAALLEQMMSVSLKFDTIAEVISATTPYIDGVRVVLMTNGAEIQCRFELEEELPDQAKKEAIIQAGVDRPQSIGERQLLMAKDDKILTMVRDYADNIILFLTRIRATCLH